jgi:hypothetical protein
MLRNTMVALLLVASAMPALAQGQGPTAAERAACEGDRAKFCGSVKPGGGKIMECLADHEEQLSDACKKVLEAHSKQ